MASSSDPFDLLSPAMRELLGRLTRAARVPMHLVPPEMARAWYEASAGVLEQHPPAMARDEVVRIPNRHGHIMLCRLWVAHSAPATHRSGLRHFAASPTPLVRHPHARHAGP